MEIKRYTEISNLTKNNPYLFPRKVWDNLLKEENKSEEVINVEYLKFSYKTLTKTEYDLLNGKGKNIAEKISETPELWKLDGVYAFAYELGTEPILPEWWSFWKQEYIESGKKDLFGNIVISKDIFKDNEFGTKYTDEILQLDLKIIFDYNKLTTIQRCLPVPIIKNIDDMVYESLGIENPDPYNFDTIKKSLISYMTDPIIIFPNIHINKLFCLQELLKVGCCIHDNLNEYEYNYCLGRKEDSINVKIVKLPDNKISMHFTSNFDKDANDKYLVWNHVVGYDMSNSIEEIINNSKYKEVI